MTEYAQIDAVNWSTLKHLAKSPLHYKHRTEAEQDDAKHMRLGRAVHTLILEPERFTERHPIFGGGARRGKAWDEFAANHAGADILIGTEAAQAQAMADAVRHHPLAQKHLRDGLAEQVLTWTDPETGVKCKGRCDSVNGHLVEFKSCNGRDFEPYKFESHAARLRYHGQLAFYADGLAAMGYEVEHDPTMIVVESDPPHDVAVYIVKDEVLDLGRKLYRKLLARFVECSESDHWPGVCADEELYLGVPAWATWEAEDAAPEQPITIGGTVMGGL